MAHRLLPGLIPNPRQSRSLPAAEGDAAAAQAALDAMPGDGVAPGRVHHNTLLAAYAAAGDLQGADAAYCRMQAAGFPADAATFRALLGSVRQWAALESEWRGSAGAPPACGDCMSS